MLEQMTQDVQLESLELKSTGLCYLSSVRVNLSNGQSSPCIEDTTCDQHMWVEKVTFNPGTSIRKVASYDGKNFIQKLQFMDALSRVVHSYNPMNLTMDVTTYALGEGEKLIGVYGSKDVYFNF